MDFYQNPPELKNAFLTDPLLPQLASKHLPAEVQSHLTRVGELAVTDWLTWAQQAEREAPELIPFDAWGRRVDEIRLSEGWRKLERAAAETGIVASGYERRYGEWSRVYQAALLYLFHPSSAFVSCPLAMTDGAARAIELYGDEDLKGRVFPKLTSRDPQTAWTSGQWMTERTGGSDVSGTSTIARKNGSGDFPWRLEGVKWFTSATTSPMAMLLARIEGAEAGSRGLSLFYTELRDSQSKLQGIEILRLKDKLGTRALPTAELQLQGTPARLVGGEGGGVKKISALFNITRVYNSICALGHWRRALHLAQSYSAMRMAFGKVLNDHPLHKATLDEQEAKFAGAFRLTFYVAHLLGKDECGTATDDERTLLRALTPVVKLYTARLCRDGVGEVVEMFGGAGFIEDTGLPVLLRDAQVFSIWEGTTNVLALDFMRALLKEGAGPALERALLPHASDPRVGELRALLQRPREEAARRMAWLAGEILADHLS